MHFEQEIFLNILNKTSRCQYDPVKEEKIEISNLILIDYRAPASMSLPPACGLPWSAPH